MASEDGENAARNVSQDNPELSALQWHAAWGWLNSKPQATALMNNTPLRSRA
jgi:hypothetical protein